VKTGDIHDAKKTTSEGRANLTIRQILKMLDKPSYDWLPEEREWLSGLLPKKAGRLGELLQVPLAFCMLMVYVVWLALFTLFVVIPLLIYKFLVAKWKAMANRRAAS